MDEIDNKSLMQKFIDFVSKENESESSEQEEEDDQEQDKDLEKTENSFESENEVIQKDDKQQIVYGIVLKNNRPDLEKDIFDQEFIEQEAHNFMLKATDFKVQHQFKTDDISIVESYVAPTDFTMNDCQVKKGDWVMATKIHNDELWKEVEQGNFRGYSVGGRAVKVPEGENK